MSQDRPWLIAVLGVAAVFIVTAAALYHAQRPWTDHIVGILGAGIIPPLVALDWARRLLWGRP